MKHPNALVQAFCKSPKLGEVKTRLSPVLSDVEILALYEQMLTLTVAQVVDHSVCTAEIWVSDLSIAAFFDQFDCQKREQSAGDLGQRMADALQCGLADFEKVILVGGDVPDIDAAYLEAAIAALDTHEVVLGPAEDGGYGLVGVRRQVPDMFTSIQWGSDEVLSQTCRRLNALKINYALLPVVWDVDTPTELPRYRQWAASRV